MRVRQKRLRAFSYAATLVAVRFARLDVRLGEISLDNADWRSRVIDRVGAMVGLDRMSQQIPGHVAVVVNWGIYALKRIGVPPHSCGELDMVRFDRETQCLDVAEFERHWPVIEELARALIERGKLSEAEVGAALDGTAARQGVEAVMDISQSQSRASG